MAKNKVSGKSSVSIDKGYKVCEDCLFALVNGDYPSDDKRAEAVLAGEKRVLPARFLSDASEGDEGAFSWRACDCCKSTLGGTRHAFALVTHLSP